jgi:hypothetical protein
MTFQVSQNNINVSRKNKPSREKNCLPFPGSFKVKALSKRNR